MSCKFGLANCRSSSSTRKYVAELAPHGLFDASRSYSSTVSVCKLAIRGGGAHSRLGHSKPQETGRVSEWPASHAPVTRLKGAFQHHVAPPLSGRAGGTPSPDTRRPATEA